MDDQGIRTSQRVSRSCVECGRRKIKCDKKVPCKPCVRRNLAHECQRPITRVRGQLTVATTHDRTPDTDDNIVDQLLKERSALQAQIAELETALALSKPCAHSHVGEPESQPPAATPGASVEDIVPALEQFDLGVSRDSDTTVISEKGIADQLYEPATDPLFLLLPSRETSEQLVTYSLQTLGWIHCAVNAPAFLKEHEEFWNRIHTGVGIDSGQRAWLAVYFAILSSALLYLDAEELPDIPDLPQLGLVQHHDELQYAVHISRLWYEVALKEVERYGCSGKSSLHVVQALSISTLCHSNFGDPQREWLFAGFATSMARCLDMHRLGSEVAHSKTLSSRPEWSTPEQREMGRRIWWTYVIRDWLGSWSRPPSIAPASFCCQFTTDNNLNHNVVIEPPNNSPSPSPLQYQAVMCRLAYIFYIYIKVNTHHTASKYIKAMEEIEAVRRNLPLHLSSKFPANIDDEEWESEHPWVPFQRYLITHALDFMQLSIARILTMSNLGSDSSRYRTLASSHAMSILQNYLSPLPRVYKLVWVVSASTVAAAVYVSLDILIKPHEYPPMKKMEYVTLLRQVAEILGHHSAVAIHASKGSQTIQRLLSYLDKDEQMSHLPVHEILRRLTVDSEDLAVPSDDFSVGPTQAMYMGIDAWDDIWNGNTLSTSHMDDVNLHQLLEPTQFDGFTDMLTER